MRKLTLLITALFLSVGMAWAQTNSNGPLVTFTNVQKNGAEFVLYITDSGVLDFSTNSATELGEAAQFRATKQSDGTWTFYNESKELYMIWRGNDSGYNDNTGVLGSYNATYCNWTVTSSGILPGAYRFVSKRSDGSTNGTIVILSDGTRFDKYGDSDGYADGYSNQFRIDVVDHFGFKPAKDYASINKWYYLTLNQYYLYNDGTSNEMYASKNAVDTDDKDAYTWAFIGNPFDGYKLANKKGGYLNCTNNGAIIGNEEHTFTLTVSTYHSPNGFFMAGEGKQRFNRNGSSGKVVYWSDADGGSTFNVVFRDDAADLQALIDNAEATLQNLGEGTTVGYVTADSKNNISEAISDAKTAIQNGSGYNAAEAALKAAVSGVKTIQPEVGKYYTINSEYYKNEGTGEPIGLDVNVNKLIFNRDFNVSKWFQFVDAGNGQFYLYNVKSGLYLSSNGGHNSGQVSASATTTADAKAVTITNMGNGNIVKIVPVGGAMIHAQAGNNVVAWNNEASNSASAWTIVEVENPGVAYIDDTNYATLQAAIEAWTEGKTINLLANTDETVVLPKGMKLDVINFNDFTAPNVKETDPVAKIGETGYLTLEAAVAAAQDNETITLVNNVALETPVVISGKALTLDLGAYTIEDKSTAVLTKEDDVWALIDLENGANLTVCGTGTIKANYAEVQGGWTGMAYCINVDNTSKLTVDGGNFINGNGGVQTLGEVVVNGGTFVSHNGGTCIMAIYTDAKVTVNGGTFKDSVEESDVYTGSGAVWAGFGAKIEIKGGTFDFAADPEHGNVVWTLFPAQNAIAGTGVNAEMTVSGGTFVNFNPAEDVIVDYSPSTGFTFGSVVAEGYTVVANADGTYGVVVDPAYGKVAKVGDAYYATLADAVAAAEGGDEVTLIANVELSATQNISKSITIDGNGNTITTAESVATNNHAAFYIDGASTLDVTIKNATFDGVNGCAVRSLDANVTIDNCVFQNGTNTGIQGLVRLTQGNATVKNSKFLNNTCPMVLSFNYDAGNGADVLVVDNCQFEGNKASTTAVLYYVKGAKCTIKDSEFIENTLNCSSNGATIYLGFTENNVVTGNLFKNNTVIDASTSTRVAGAIFFGYEAEVSGNAFVNNTASNANGDVLGQVCTSTYYDCTIDLDGNYWGGNAPAYGADYTVQHQTGEGTFALNSYYTVCGTDENGNVVLSDKVEIKNVAKVGKFGYASLQAAVEAATDGATVTMLSDVELTEAVKVVGKAITLDLNGKTVSGTCNSSQGHLVYIENGAGLTVKDGAVDGGGKLTYAQGTSNVGWTVAVMGNLTLESGTIELTGEWSIGYAVDVRPNAWGVAYTAPSMFTMNGGNVVSSDGAVRVASSSSDQYANVSASFVMNGGEIDAAWDGVFIQQSNEAYDVLNFTINEGTIKSGLNPVRVYGPAPTSYVNGQECMSINFNGGTMTYTGTETREWVIDGVLRVGGGSSIETIVENGNITAGEAFAQAQALPDGYKWEQDGETYKVVEAPATGKISYRAYINDSESREAVQVDLENVYARNSLVVKLFDAEGNALTTTTLKQGGVEAAAYTCNIVLWGTASGSWDTEIHAEKLTVANYPQKGELWIDGNLVDTFDGILGKVTDAAAYQLPIYLALDCVYKEAKVGETYYATLADAVAAAEGETVTMLADVELAEAVTIPAGKVVTLDLNGKTVSQSKECTASYAMITNNGSLTITGNGKLSFTDTSAGDPSFGWGSYTINNLGTLVVENGTIEHLGAQTFAKHMICAIFQYSGSTTINGGTISTPSYRSARLWKGDMTINGGEFDGQLWVQAVDDSAKLTINGGTFAPNGGDGSSVFVGNVDSKGNLRNVEFAVTDGTFTTKIGCSNADEIAGDGIKGGKFTESAMNNTNSALLAEGFVFAGEAVDGYYGIVEAPKTPEVVDGKIEFIDGEFDMYTNDTDIEGVEITYKRTIDSDWNALYVPFAIPASELLADFDIAYINDVRETDEDDDGELDGWQMELIKIKKETAVLRANHPYFVRSKSADYTENNLSLTLTTTLYKATVAEFECSSVYSTYTVKGLNELRASTEFGDADRVLGYDNGETTWGKMADGYSLKPFRFYLTITNLDGSPVVSSAQMSIVVRDEDGTTGIGGIYGDENGETVIFDLYGRRVLEPEKGNIYIINGKKVLVK